jgi:hypothetical protein
MCLHLANLVMCHLFSYPFTVGSTIKNDGGYPHGHPCKNRAKKP